MEWGRSWSPPTFHCPLPRKCAHPLTAASAAAVRLGPSVLCFSVAVALPLRSVHDAASAYPGGSAHLILRNFGVLYWRINRRMNVRHSQYISQPLARLFCVAVRRLQYPEISRNGVFLVAARYICGSISLDGPKNLYLRRLLYCKYKLRLKAFAHLRKAASDKTRETHHSHTSCRRQ